MFTWNSVAAATNSDTIVTSGAGAEATSLSTTVDTVGEATDLFDFRIADGGTSDGLATTVSQIVLHVSGTSTTTERGNIAWRLNGPDASNVTGIYSAGTVTFSGLSISVANGGNETYTVNGYFTLTPGLTDGHTITLSTDGDTDFTLGGSGTQMATTSAVTNGSGFAIAVVATKLGFTTQPAGSVSGAALTTQPVVAAQDFAGNTDTDFTGNISLAEASAGALSGTATVAATGGVASFSGLTYTASTDQESFTLTASSTGLTDGTASAVASDVVASKLVFTTQPAPTSLTSGTTTSFTTIPVVAAQDANGTVDTGYATSIVLSVTDPNDGTLDGTANSLTGTGDTDATATTVTLAPSSGVATYSGLALRYTNGLSGTEYVALKATSGALTTANSSTITSTSTAFDPVIGASSGTVANPLTSPSSGDVSNCNAQDVSNVSFAAINVYNTCTASTDTGRAQVRITYDSVQRYDMSFVNSVAGDSLVGGAGAMQSYLGDTTAGSALTKDATIEYTCADNDHNGLVDVTGLFVWNQTNSVFVLPTPPAKPVINTPKCTSATLYNISGLSTASFADTIPPVITGPVGPAVADGTTTGATSAITVNENQRAVVQVSATDDLTASASITWSLSGDDAAKFTIAADGTITFNAAPDFETPTDTGDTAQNNTYVVVITATDASNNATTQTLTVTVANLDEIAPVITGPVGPAVADGTTTGLTSAITVNENQRAVTQVTADESVTWSLSGDDAALFSIAADGTITFNTAPDFEAPTDTGDTAQNNTYVVVITATDASNNATTQTLTVTVAQVLFPGEPVALAQDADQDGIPDAVESSVADRDGDGIVDSADYDPQGYFYCQADGRILTGGSVSVTGPGTVTMVSNGSLTGEYQWYVSAPGTYTMAIDTSGMEFSTIATTSAGTLTLASQPGNPIVLGSTENGTTGYLGAFNGTPYDAANPTAYYTTFVIAEGDANVIANNIPFAGCGANEVTIAGTTNAVEPNSGTAQDGLFTISLTRAAPVDTVITYSVSGTATSGADFTALSGTVTIPAGQTSATITVPVLEDGLVEGAETVVLTLTSVTGDTATALASTPSASITIGDDLIDTIRDALSNILASDLARTVDTQSRQFAAMSKGALGRLQSFDEAACDAAPSRSKEQPR